LKSKQCTKCKKEKSVDEFYKFIGGHNNLRAQCKACDLEYSRKRNGSFPKHDEPYIINKETMSNHMYLHFGFTESRINEVDRWARHRDLRKYYKEEQSEKLK